jgi:7-cyano-7-deazaguanine synthase
MAKDTLLILSGGLDSTTMLHEFSGSIAAALNFSYGACQNEREAECARWQCASLGIELIEIDLAFMKRHFESALLKSADDVPEGSYAESNMASTVVPFRNGIMLAIAAGLAESKGLKKVMMANHGGDHAVYPDCRPEFVSAMGSALKAGTYTNIELIAPYTGISKTDIARRGKELGVDYSHTYSCYKGGEHHCGRCATCIERRQALDAAGISCE